MYKNEDDLTINTNSTIGGDLEIVVKDHHGHNLERNAK